MLHYFYYSCQFDLFSETCSEVDVDDFVYKHVFCHVDMFDINIPICFPRLLCGIILSQCSSILTMLDTTSPNSKTIALSYTLF